MNKISAKIIADSANEFGNRLTTFILVYPRIVHSEFMTHRMLSKNSASSRAIPFKKMLQIVKENPFIPIKWMKEHSGMQGTEYLTDSESSAIRTEWLRARDKAIEHAEYLSDRGLTKQLCNRLLEPFMWHTVICTGSEWSNFFALRAHEAAEIHIQDLAFKMLDAYNNSKPKQLKAEEWHIPFGETFDTQRIIDGKAFSEEFDGFAFGLSGDIDYYINEYKIRIATARCARVSYLNFEGKDDYEADIQLHNRLLSMGHMSPFEHCAKAMNNSDWYGNFKGFKQYRKFLKGENKKDSRILNW